MPIVSAKPAVHRSPGGGFSLVELLVVVMVILVIAAIAIPSMLRARMRANEAAAVGSISVIHTAEAVYFDTYPPVGFAGNLADLGSHGSNCDTPSKTNSCIIMDDALTSGLKSGYVFELVGDGNVPDGAYTVTATPESASTSGRCTYTSNQSGHIEEKPANRSKPGRFSIASTPACGQR